jgi:hypothetical protein
MNGIAIWVCHEGISIHDIVRFGNGHDFCGGYVYPLTLLQKGSRVALGEECTTWGPGEFETERVVGTFGGGQSY